MKKAKKFFIISISTIAIIITVFLIVVAGFIIDIEISAWKRRNETKDWTALDFYCERWDMEFPDDAKIEYHASTMHGFMYEGETFTSCSVNELSDDFKKLFSDDTSGKSFAKFNEIVDRMQRHADVISKEIDTKFLKTPNENCVWYMRKNDMDTIVMAYDNQKNMLYIIESIM